MVQIPVPGLLVRRAAFNLVVCAQDRKRFRSLRSVFICQAKDHRDGNSQSSTENDEIPERGQSEEKDEGTTDRKHEPRESGADGKFVHADTGMTLLSHTPPLP